MYSKFVVGKLHVKRHLEDIIQQGRMILRLFIGWEGLNGYRMGYAYM
jgi:hypothetical protein